MPAFYLTFIAVLLSGIGGRDQATVAGLGLAQGRRPAVLVVAVSTSLTTAFLAAWMAGWILVQLPPPARPFLAAIALGLAGAESLVRGTRRQPSEPTNSLGALALVLLAGQVADAARFVVFGMAVGLAAPSTAGAAGMLAGSLLVMFAWAMPEPIGAPSLRWIRRGCGFLLLVAALVIFLRQNGIL